MRHRLVIAATCTAALAVVAPFALAPSASADVPFAQQVSLVTDGPTTTFYVSKQTGYTGYGKPTFARSSHRIDMNVYKLSEKVKGYNYYFVDVDTRLKSKSGSSAGSMTLTAWTAKTTTQMSYTKSVSASKSSCATLSVGISGAMGPIGAGATVSKPVLCGKSAKGRLSTSGGGRIGTYAITAPSLAKHGDFKKFIRVQAGKNPVLNVRISGPCDYENSVHDVIHTTCSDTYALHYKAYK